ncbi:MAG: hypothetical protein KIH63_002970 [Candidatus Saccharibacteria bacterium]|nr:hypothetical protein [Candidatus Saccharibacteria bacterium]
MAGPLPPPGLVEIVLSPSHWADPRPAPDCWVEPRDLHAVLLAGDLVRFVDQVEHPLLNGGYERVETHTEGPMPHSDMPIGMSRDIGDANVLGVVVDTYHCYEPSIVRANFTDGTRFDEANQQLLQNPLDPAAPIHDLQVARYCSYGFERVTRRPYLAKTVLSGQQCGIMARVLPEFAIGEHRMDRPQDYVMIDSPDREIGVTYQHAASDGRVSLSKIVQVDVFAPVNK